MDPIPECRDKCASSADQLSCLRDCTGARPTVSAAPRAGPVSPFYNRVASLPQRLSAIIDTDASRNGVLAAVVVVAAVSGIFIIAMAMKKKK